MIRSPTGRPPISQEISRMIWFNKPSEEQSLRNRGRWLLRQATCQADLRAVAEVCKALLAEADGVESDCASVAGG